MRIVLALLVLVPVWAQPPQEKEASKRQMPEPKNLQVLKLPASELMPVMRTFTTGLGVKCGFCHAMPNFASDEKPEKVTARKMIVMAQEINAKFSDGQIHVTCYTCHRGETEPKTAAPATAAQ